MGIKVTPALEGAARTGLDRHNDRVEHEVALTDALFVNIGPQLDEALTTQYFPANHPIDRTAIDQFSGALWHHASAMQMFGLLAARATTLLTDPVLKILDRIATHTELDEMQCHARKLLCADHRAVDRARRCVDIDRLRGL